MNYPVVLGHEFAGIIAKTGSRVRGYKEGDRVVSETAAVLPADSPFTRRGLYNLEPKRLGFGYGVNGAMAPFVKVPARCLHHVPASLSLEKAALTEPCCVAYNAVCVNSHLRPGDTVAVIGPGPIGLLCAVMAKLAGAGHLAVIGIPADAHRLEVAQNIGAETTLGAKGEDIVEWVKNFGDGYGLDLVIDAAGVSASLKLALDIVRPAGQVTKVGWGRSRSISRSIRWCRKRSRFRAAFRTTGRSGKRSSLFWPAARLILGPILNRVSPLKDWQSAFDEMHSGQIVKGVLIP